MELRYLTISPAAMVQQLALSTLRYGYRYYVSGMLPQGKDPFAFDQRIIEKYDLQITDYNRRQRAALGKANMKFFRCGQFFLLLATEGQHRFKELEHRSIRCAQTPGTWRRRLRWSPDREFEFAPIVVPAVELGRAKGNRPRYEVSYVRRGYEKKTDAERDAFKTAVAAWKASGRKGKKPSHGKKAEGWVSRVSIERQCYRSLQSHYLNIATKRSHESLTKMLLSLPFEPYAPVQQQLHRLVRAINNKRKQCGIRELLDANEAIRWERKQLTPFVQGIAA